MKRKYQVKGMHCAACSAAVERVLKKLEGVEEVQVNLLNEQAVVSGKSLPEDAMMIEKVAKAGFELIPNPSQTFTYKVEGMHCAACSAAVERVLRKQESVLEVQVNLLMNKAMITAYEEQFESWAAVVEKVGFKLLQTSEAMHHELVLEIGGMHCAACSAAIERKLHKTAGISQVEVSLLTNKAVIQYDLKQIKTNEIIQLIEKLGFTASVPQKAKASEDDSAQKRLKLRIYSALALALVLLYVGMSHMLGPITLPLPRMIHYEHNPFGFALIQWILATLILINGFGFFTRGLKALKNGSANMDTLVAIGTGSAYLYSCVSLVRIFMGDVHAVHELYFEGAGVVVALVQFGKHLEAISKAKSASAISALLQLRPDSAVLLRNGKEVTVSIDEICTGDILVVKAGDHVPVDGEIIEGSSNLDESMLSGESMPVKKQLGDHVSQGTINLDGKLLVRCSCELEETALSKIIRLVEEAQSKKAPIARIADKVSGIFVPAVMSIALAAGIIWYLITRDLSFALSIFVAVMVIACPCSLGLATPTAIMVGSGKAAQLGIFIKSGEALETTAHIDAAVFDKTGTITVGKPVVEQVITEYDLEEVKKIACALESGSNHPLAKAILAMPHESASIEEIKTLNGYGMQGSYQQQNWYLGSEAMMRRFGLQCDSWQDKELRAHRQGKSVVYLGNEQEVCAMFVIGDALKENVAQVMDQLKAMGVEVYLLSGDNALCVEAIAKEAHIEHVFAQVLPHEKSDKIKELQAAGKKVAMIGDGINDAIALSQADVGIAIGSGSDVAIESADIVLMKDDVKDIQTAMKLSRAVIRNIHQNLFWAFFYNSVGIPIAAGILYPIWGILLSPVFAGAAMAFSSVSVVSNALRLRKFKS